MTGNHTSVAVDDGGAGMQTPVRWLAPSEEMFVSMGAYVGYSVHIRGRLELSALSDAFAVLRRTYPVLATRLVAMDGGHLIVAYSDTESGVGVCDDGVDEPMAGADLYPDKKVTAVHVARGGDGDRAVVTLLIHHSIADGHHGLALLADLWSLYTDITSGSVPAAVRHDYPESVEKLFADRRIADFSYAELPPCAAVRRFGTATNLQLPGFVSTFVRCRLSVAETAALLELSHRCKVTMNSVVSAAIILTESDVRRVRLCEIPYFITVDLRNRVTPPVEPTAGTNILGFAGFSASIDTTDDLVVVARAVAGQLSTELADGTVVKTALRPRQFLTDLMSPAAPESVITTNWGRIPALRSPTGIEFTDFRAVFYNKPQEPHTLVPTQATGFHSYVISSFDERLSVELLVPNATQLESARARVASLEARLHSIG
ncbi:phthiocerol/phthiodiolone dimycocerosyl transferase family protein [Mycobacterium heidelbergense]|uniref:phthiocerol/phthiodiolone dimycocerosyl transferase family protein n=1 Tax=Mycobacterium heidelbergense TaxID=53376 RepID=UPI003CEDCB53